MATTAIKTGVECATREPRKSLWSRFTLMMGLRRQRLTLTTLDDHMLRDIGVTRQNALIEAEKPVWDVPRHWSQ